MAKLDLQPVTELDLQPYEEGETVLDLREVESQAKDVLRIADETENPKEIIEDFYEPIKDEENTLNLFKPLVFADPSEAPFQKIISEKDTRIGLAEQIRRMDAVDWTSRVPFSPTGLLHNLAIYKAVKRIQKNEYDKIPLPKRDYRRLRVTENGVRRWRNIPLTIGEMREKDIGLVEEYFLKQNEEQARGSTFGAKVFAGATYLPGWMIEFLATGGLDVIGKKAAKETAEKMLQSYAKTKAGQILLKSSGWTGGAITRATLGMPHRVAEKAIARQLPKQVHFGPNDELVFDIDPESWATSIFKGWLHTVVEVASEQSGEGLTVGAKALAGRLPFGSKVVAALSKLKPGESVGRFFTRAGWSNLLAEFGEERLATILHGILDTEDFGTGPDSNMFDRLKEGISQDIEQFPVELAVLSLPSGVRYVAGKAVRVMEPQTEAEGNQLELESDGQEATEASRQYTNQPASEDLSEAEIAKEEISYVKKTLHKLGIRDKGDYEPLTDRDYREIYKFLQMPSDVGLSFPQFKPIYETQRGRELAKLNLDIYFAQKLQPYFQLDKEGRSKVDAALCEADRNPTVTFGPKQLKKMGLDDVQTKAFLAVRTSFDESLNMLIRRMEDAGVDEKTINDFKARASNYIPHKWHGNWAVVVRERVGRRKVPPTKREIAEAALEGRPIESKVKEVELKRPRTIFMSKTNYTDRMKERERLQKLYPDAEVIIFKAKKIPYQAFQESAPWAVHRMVDMVIEKAEVNPETAAGMREALADLYKSKGFGMHFIKRRNIPGYTEDLQRPIAEYFNGFAGYITKMQAIKEFSENLTGINAQRTPNLYRYALDYIKYVTGEQPEFMRAKRVAYFYYLWGNVKSASLNLTQNITLGWPVLSKHTNFALPKILQAQVRAAHPAMLTEGEREFITKLENAGHLKPQLTQEISAYAKNPLMQGLRTKVGKTISFLDVFRHIETFNRKAMAVALWDSGITNVEEAGRIIEEAHFRYGKGNRPVFARGYISPVLVFRSWGINYFTWVKDEIKAGRVAPEVKSLLAIVFLGGLKALPFASLFVWLWRKVFGTDPETELRNAIGKTAGQMAMRGAPSKIGISFTGSISPMDIPSPADIGTFQKTVTELGGVFADVPMRVGRIGKSLAVKNYTRALEDASPEVLRNPLAAYRLYDEGMRTRGGRIILDLESGEPMQMTSGEMIRKMLGYQPIRMAEQYDLQKALNQFYGDRLKLKQNWADRFWLSFLNDDPDEMLNITQEIVDYNAKMEKRGRENDMISVKEMDDMLTVRTRPVNIPPMMMMPKYQEILNKFYQREFEKEK